MKLICKDTNKGSITFFTKGKYAFRGVDRNDTTDDVPDPILDVNNYNESIQFYSKTPGMCEVDWGDGNKEQFPFVKDRSESIYGRYRLMFRRRDISYRKNPDSHPWWFYKEDGSEYIPAPNHAYADGLDKERVITMTFTNDITYVQTARIMMVGFPILDAPSIINLILSITGDGNITDIPKDRIRRSVNIEYITLSELGVGILTSIPDDWDRLTKLKGINLSRTADFNDTESSITMSSSASDGKRNQFYGLYLSMYLAANPVDKRPSGVLQAPSGFIKGQSNGSPSTPMEMVYVLMNNYGWRFSMAPEASVLRSIRSSDIDTRSYKPYKLIVFDDGRTFVGNGDVLAHDTDKVLSFGGQPEGEYLCDSMGLDRNVIVEYFNKIGNG